MSFVKNTRDQWRVIKLTQSTFHFDNWYYKEQLMSQVPYDSVDWVNKQINYYMSHHNTIIYDLVILLTLYSMSAFNRYIDGKQITKLKMWKTIKIKPNKASRKVINYILNSPKPTQHMTVYSGIDYIRYKSIKDLKNWYNKRFTATTFDMYHAIMYATRARKKTYKKGGPYVVLRLHIKPYTSCSFFIAENQVVLPPYALFKYKDESIEYHPYKDINEKYKSKEIFRILLIDYDVYHKGFKQVKKLMKTLK
jgi:hypothetical protein